ncbi:hypothetical protein CL634_08855 [bacterium]|nr:hypothetical protein [bacterium]
MKKTRFVTTTKKSLVPGHNEDRPLTVIIPIAGIGHRMKSYGPKCLLPVNDKETIIQKSINTVRNVYPQAEIIVVVGFEADKVIKLIPDDVRIIENQIYENTNVVESLRLALNCCTNKDIIIIYGDLIYNSQTIEDVTANGSCIVIDSQGKFRSEEVGVTVVDNAVTNFAYGLPTKWSHIIYMEEKESTIFKNLCRDRRRNKMYPFEILNFMISKGCRLKVTEPDGMDIKEIDSLKDL